MGGARVGGPARPSAPAGRPGCRRRRGAGRGSSPRRRCAAVAQELLGTGTPAVQRHGAWLLALLAMGEGDAAAALAHLCALGKDERLSVLPLFPPDVTDRVPLVRIALAAGDGELAR